VERTKSHSRSKSNSNPTKIKRPIGRQISEEIKMNENEETNRRTVATVITTETGIGVDVVVVEDPLLRKHSKDWRNKMIGIQAIGIGIKEGVEEEMDEWMDITGMIGIRAVEDVVAVVICKGEDEVIWAGGVDEDEDGTTMNIHRWAGGIRTESADRNDHLIAMMVVEDKGGVEVDVDVVWDRI
jgi:hypothetical protein